jgi:hypothetical protein
VRPLSQTDSDLRQAIVNLNQHRLPEKVIDDFVKQGKSVVPMLERLAVDEQVADLPRCNALIVLFALQGRGPSLEDLEKRDRASFVDLLVSTLQCSRPKVRGQAATTLISFMGLNKLLRRPASLDSDRLTEAIQAAMQAGLPKAKRQFVERWLTDSRRKVF